MWFGIVEVEVSAGQSENFYREFKFFLVQTIVSGACRLKLHCIVLSYSRSSVRVFIVKSFGQEAPLLQMTKCNLIQVNHSPRNMKYEISVLF